MDTQNFVVQIVYKSSIDESRRKMKVFVCKTLTLLKDGWSLAYYQIFLKFSKGTWKSWLSMTKCARCLILNTGTQYFLFTILHIILKTIKRLNAISRRLVSKTIKERFPIFYKGSMIPTIRKERHTAGDTQELIQFEWLPFWGLLW